MPAVLTIARLPSLWTRRARTRWFPAGGRLQFHPNARRGLAARTFHRTLKLARTIADLAGADAISAAYLAEAVQYRRRTAL